MNTPSLTLSVVSHGQAALCADLLADIARLRPPQLARIILTLNIPEDPPAWPDALPCPVEIVRNAAPLGFAENHNRAFAIARSAHFAVVNPDIRLEHDPFPALLDALADAAVGMAAPQVVEADGRIADHARALVTPWQVIKRRFVQTAAAPVRTDWIAGMFMVFRAEVFAKIGGFDQRFRLYCEDVDLCLRLQLAGLRLAVVDAARVTHLARRASRRSFKPLYWHVSSLLRLWTSPVYRQYRALPPPPALERANEIH